MCLHSTLVVLEGTPPRCAAAACPLSRTAVVASRAKATALCAVDSVLGVRVFLVCSCRLLFAPSDVGWRIDFLPSFPLREGPFAAGVVVWAVAIPALALLRNTSHPLPVGEGVQLPPSFFSDVSSHPDSRWSRVRGAWPPSCVLVALGHGKLFLVPDGARADRPSICWGMFD